MSSRNSADVMAHLGDADVDRAFQAQDVVGNRIADQDHVDPSFISQACERGVVGGNHHDRVEAVATLTFRDSRSGDLLHGLSSAVQRPMAAGSGFSLGSVGFVSALTRSRTSP